MLRERGQGRSDTVSTRFTLWEDGDTGRLINLWNKENQRQVRKQINRKKSTRPPPRAAAMIQLERGQLSRARRLLQSNGLADITDDAIAAQLRDKHPPRSSELSVDVNSLPEFDVEFALDKRYSRLNIN